MPPTSDRYKAVKQILLHATQLSILLLQVPELPVYGVAIPTVSGMRLVLDELGAAQGDASLQHTLALWQLRGGKRGVQLHS